MPDHTPTKAELRRTIRARRRARSEQDRDRASYALTQHALAEPLITQAKTVIAYNSMPWEPGIVGLTYELRDLGIRVLLPVMQEVGLAFAEYTGDLAHRQLGNSRLHIGEPPGPHIPVSEAQVLLMPALAIDRRGVRLGQGGGYYDRTDLRGPILIGVVHDDEFLTAPLPAEPHDTVVQGVLTPTGLTWLSPPNYPGAG